MPPTPNTRPRLVGVLIAMLLISACGNPLEDQQQNSSTTQPSPDPSTTTVETAELRPCPTYKPSTTAGPITDSQLNELSGLAKSAQNTNVLWTHNDSGDDARVFPITTAGKLLGTFDLD